MHVFRLCVGRFLVVLSMMTGIVWGSSAILQHEIRGEQQDLDHYVKMQAFQKIWEIAEKNALDFQDGSLQINFHQVFSDGLLAENLDIVGPIFNWLSLGRQLKLLLAGYAFVKNQLIKNKSPLSAKSASIDKNAYLSFINGLVLQLPGDPRTPSRWILPGDIMTDYFNVLDIAGWTPQTPYSDVLSQKFIYLVQIAEAYHRYSNTSQKHADKLALIYDKILVLWAYANFCQGNRDVALKYYDMMEDNAFRRLVQEGSFDLMALLCWIEMLLKGEGGGGEKDRAEARYFYELAQKHPQFSRPGFFSFANSPIQDEVKVIEKLLASPASS